MPSHLHVIRALGVHLWLWKKVTVTFYPLTFKGKFEWSVNVQHFVDTENVQSRSRFEAPISPGGFHLKPEKGRKKVRVVSHLCLIN